MILRGQLRGKVGRCRILWALPLKREGSLFARLLRDLRRSTLVNDLARERRSGLVSGGYEGCRNSGLTSRKDVRIVRLPAAGRAFAFPEGKVRRPRQSPQVSGRRIGPLRAAVL